MTILWARLDYWFTTVGRAFREVLQMRNNLLNQCKSFEQHWGKAVSPMQALGFVAVRSPGSVLQQEKRLAPQVISTSL